MVISTRAYPTCKYNVYGDILPMTVCVHLPCLVLMTGTAKILTRHSNSESKELKLFPRNFMLLFALIWKAGAEQLNSTFAAMPISPALAKFLKATVFEIIYSGLTYGWPNFGTQTYQLEIVAAVFYLFFFCRMLNWQFSCDARIWIQFLASLSLPRPILGRTPIRKPLQIWILYPSLKREEAMPAFCSYWQVHHG